jgi:hypothetical protein
MPRLAFSRFHRAIYRMTPVGAASQAGTPGTAVGRGHRSELADGVGAAVCPTSCSFADPELQSVLPPRVQGRGRR